MRCSCQYKNHNISYVRHHNLTRRPILIAGQEQGSYRLTQHHVRTKANHQRAFQPQATFYSTLIEFKVFKIQPYRDAGII